MMSSDRLFWLINCLKVWSIYNDMEKRLTDWFVVFVVPKKKFFFAPSFTIIFLYTCYIHTHRSSIYQKNKKHFRFCKSGCDNYLYVRMQSLHAIFDHSHIIHPSPRTTEHKASIGNREMSLTMCGCFQLTSEACYKYSDVAHCALMLCRTQTDAIMKPDSTWIYFSRATCVHEQHKRACISDWA